MVEVEESRVVGSNEEYDGMAGTFKCISCGVNGSPTGFKTVEKGIEVPTASIILSSSVTDKSIDRDQLIAVLNRQAGLKPMGVQHHPMRPKSHYTARKNESSEPLYRKAKIANQFRDIQKIPSASFSHSTSSPYILDDGNGNGFYQQNSVDSIRPQSHSGSRQNVSSAGVINYMPPPNAQKIILPTVKGGATNAIED
jgi:hypothetical protein